jgi:hypothetical protein
VGKSEFFGIYDEISIISLRIETNLFLFHDFHDLLSRTQNSKNNLSWFGKFLGLDEKPTRENYSDVFIVISNGLSSS